MSDIAIHAIRIATTDEAFQVNPGGISKVIAYQGIVSATAVVDAATLPLGASGFLLKGVTGNTLCRVKGAAVNTAGTPDQVLVLETETQYIPANVGDVLSVMEVV